MCVLIQAESLQRGLYRVDAGNLLSLQQVQQELNEVENKMWQLEKEREEKCKRMMDRRVHQVNTLQELGESLSFTVDQIFTYSLISDWFIRVFKQLLQGAIGA